MQEQTNGAGPCAVYVQTNAAPNEVIAYRRASDGSLEPIDGVATGGDGDGSPHLQSQGSVTLTDDGRHLLVTNAASDDLSVFSVAPDGSLQLRERVHTGATPRSVDEHEGLMVVLNAGEPSLASFRLDSANITPVEGGRQALQADADPAQVAFGPGGSMVTITERGTDSIVTYEIAADGAFGASQTVASEGPTPYGFAFTSGGTLVVTEAFRAEKGATAASSYEVVDGALVPEFRGVLETDNGATILFEWNGLATLADSGMRLLLGSLIHTTDDPRYRWLNARVCAVEGEVHPRSDGTGSEVVFEVSEMIWEGVEQG